MVASILIFTMTLGTMSFLITTRESWVPHLIKDIVIPGAAIITMSESAALYLKRHKN